MVSSSSRSPICPWPTATIGFRHQALDAVGQHADAAHPVVDEEDLAVAAQLALDGLAHQHVVILGQHRVDGLALLGRRVDGAHVADAAQAHVQRARDGRGAQREHVDLGAQLLELLLLGHAKALLFVDDQHAQILELQLSAQQAVGADDQIDRAVAPAPSMMRRLLGRRAEAAEHLDLDGEVASAAG